MRETGLLLTRQWKQSQENIWLYYKLFIWYKMGLTTWELRRKEKSCGHLTWKEWWLLSKEQLLDVIEGICWKGLTRNVEEKEMPGEREWYFFRIWITQKAVEILHWGFELGLPAHNATQILGSSRTPESRLETQNSRLHPSRTELEPAFETSPLPTPYPRVHLHLRSTGPWNRRVSVNKINASEEL